MPERTHRLRRVALPGSVGPLRAPGCHRVQERVQEDPSECRHTEHRGEVTGHEDTSVTRPFTDFLRLCSALTGRKRGKRKKKAR